MTDELKESMQRWIDHHSQRADALEADVVKLREALQRGLASAKLGFPALTSMPPQSTLDNFIKDAERVLAETEPKGETNANR